MSPATVWAWAPVVRLHSLQMSCGRVGYVRKGPQVSPLSGKTLSGLPELLDDQDNNAGSFPAAGGGTLNVTRRKPVQKGSSTSNGWREMSGGGQHANPTGSPTEMPCPRLCSS